MQNRKLTLKAERLTELTADELVSVAGAGGKSIDVDCLNNRVSDQFVVTGCLGCAPGTGSGSC